MSWSIYKGREMNLCTDMVSRHTGYLMHSLQLEQGILEGNNNFIKLVTSSFPVFISSSCSKGKG